jgi:hypothetical protein
LCPFLHNIGMNLSAPGFITSSNCDFRITAFSLKIQIYKRYTCHVRIQSGLKNDLNTEFWVLNWYYNLKFWTSQKLCSEAPTSRIQRDTEKMGFADHKLCKKDVSEYKHDFCRFSCCRFWLSQAHCRKIAVKNWM